MFISGLYWYSNENNIDLTYNHIKGIYRSTKNEKWLLFGDFNIIILNSAEKHSSNAYDQHTISNLQSTLSHLSLDYKDNKFTWENIQANKTRIKERLDIFVLPLIGYLFPHQY